MTNHQSGHGGNIHIFNRENPGKKEIIDFSANINPLGPPPWLRSLISRSLSDIVHYPDPDCHDFISAVSRKHNISQDRIIPANGTTELLYLLPKVLDCSRAVIPVPSYIDYQKVMEMNAIPVEKIVLSDTNNFRLDFDFIEKLLNARDVVVLGTPNNPTAQIIQSEDLLALADRFPLCWFLVDEAFHDFIDGGNSVAGKRQNIITLHSLTKFFAVPGLRLGYGVFPKDIAQKMRTILPPWTVNTFAQKVGEQVFQDEKYYADTRENCRVLNTSLYQQLCSFKELKVFPSVVNYFLIKILSDVNSVELQKQLYEKNILIRNCGNYEGLDDRYFRVAVRSEEENVLLIESLSFIFKADVTTFKRQTAKKKNKTLMVQGTSSNAGKSVIVAALCRIMIQDGIRVAPFKAQNMSLNSFVTHDGLEMGRAQVVQAQAAKLDPDIRMNPVLLKPNSDVGSQIIVHGKPVGNMAVSEYVAYKNTAGSKACQSFDSLADDYEAVILEGAGSPGEVNLKSHDIVNMQMAKYAKSPVILVGDIDRGGVYASFIGTMEVLEEWERKLVAGFLVNRFRGDASLLTSAHEYVYNHTGKTVLGTVPYIKDLGIPEEDSVSFKEGKLQKPRPQGKHVEIALINLPHISNFTDIEPFLEEPDVYLHIIESVNELKKPDAIIIPGSKNVIGDLRYLRESGLGDKIRILAADGCETVGICGGYQILGKYISDPHSIESDKEKIDGLQLLDIITVLAPEKTLTRKEGKHISSGLPVFGYEIHHGISESSAQPLLSFQDNTKCGTVHSEDPIWGAYLHGLFDSDPFRRWFIDSLREKRGYAPINRIVSSYNLEKSFDNLANIVRKSIDMDNIYKLMGI